MVDPSADHRREPDIPPNPSMPVAGRPPGVSGSSGFPAVDVATTGERSEVHQSTVETELEAGTTTKQNHNDQRDYNQQGLPPGGPRGPVPLSTVGALPQRPMAESSSDSDSQRSERSVRRRRTPPLFMADEGEQQSSKPAGGPPGMTEPGTSPQRPARPAAADHPARTLPRQQSPGLAPADQFWRSQNAESRYARGAASKAPMSSNDSSASSEESGRKGFLKPSKLVASSTPDAAKAFRDDFLARSIAVEQEEPDQTNPGMPVIATTTGSRGLSRDNEHTSAASKQDPAPEDVVRGEIPFLGGTPPSLSSSSIGAKPTCAPRPAAAPTPRGPSLARITPAAAAAPSEGELAPLGQSEVKQPESQTLEENPEPMITESTSTPSLLVADQQRLAAMSPTTTLDSEVFTETLPVLLEHVMPEGVKLHGSAAFTPSGPSLHSRPFDVALGVQPGLVGKPPRLSDDGEEETDSFRPDIRDHWSPIHAMRGMACIASGGVAGSYGPLSASGLEIRSSLQKASNLEWHQHGSIADNNHVGAVKILIVEFPYNQLTHVDWAAAQGLPEAEGHAKVDLMARLPSAASCGTPRAMAFTRVKPDGDVIPFLPAAPFPVDLMAGPEDARAAANTAAAEFFGSILEDPGGGGPGGLASILIDELAGRPRPSVASLHRWHKQISRGYTTDMVIVDDETNDLGFAETRTETAHKYSAQSSPSFQSIRVVAVSSSVADALRSAKTADWADWIPTIHWGTLDSLVASLSEQRPALGRMVMQALSEFSAKGFRSSYWRQRPPTYPVGSTYQASAKYLPLMGVGPAKILGLDPWMHVAAGVSVILATEGQSPSQNRYVRRLHLDIGLPADQSTSTFPLPGSKTYPFGTLVELQQQWDAKSDQYRGPRPVGLGSLTSSPEDRSWESASPGWLMVEALARQLPVAMLDSTGLCVESPEGSVYFPISIGDQILQLAGQAATEYPYGHLRSARPASPRKGDGPSYTSMWIVVLPESMAEAMSRADGEIAVRDFAWASAAEMYGHLGNLSPYHADFFAELVRQRFQPVLPEMGVHRGLVEGPLQVAVSPAASAPAPSSRAGVLCEVCDSKCDCQACSLDSGSHVHLCAFTDFGHAHDIRIARIMDRTPMPGVRRIGCFCAKHVPAGEYIVPGSAPFAFWDCKLSLPSDTSSGYKVMSARVSEAATTIEADPSLAMPPHFAFWGCRDPYCPGVRECDCATLTCTAWSCSLCGLGTDPGTCICSKRAPASPAFGDELTGFERLSALARCFPSDSTSVLAPDAEAETAAARILDRVRVVPYGILGKQWQLGGAEIQSGYAPDVLTVVVDVVSLDSLQTQGPSAAGGVNKALYELVGIDSDASFPEAVRASVTAAHRAKYHRYGDFHVIHVAKPSFGNRFVWSAAYNQFTWLKAVDALSEAYASVLRQFAKFMARTGSEDPDATPPDPTSLTLRLPPLLSRADVPLPFRDDYYSMAPAVMFRALRSALETLSEKWRFALHEVHSDVGPQLVTCVYSEQKLSQFLAAAREETSSDGGGSGTSGGGSSVGGTGSAARPLIPLDANQDYKSLLNVRLMQEGGWLMAEYSHEKAGPAHALVFTATVVLKQDLEYRSGFEGSLRPRGPSSHNVCTCTGGDAPSKKAAEKSAAHVALVWLAGKRPHPRYGYLPAKIADPPQRLPEDPPPQSGTATGLRFFSDEAARSPDRFRSADAPDEASRVAAAAGSRASGGEDTVQTPSRTVADMEDAGSRPPSSVLSTSSHSSALQVAVTAFKWPGYGEGLPSGSPSVSEISSFAAAIDGVAGQLDESGAVALQAGQLPSLSQSIIDRLLQSPPVEVGQAVELVRKGMINLITARLGTEELTPEEAFKLDEGYVGAALSSNAWNELGPPQFRRAMDGFTQIMVALAITPGLEQWGPEAATTLVGIVLVPAVFGNRRRASSAQEYWESTQQQLQELTVTPATAEVATDVMRRMSQSLSPPGPSEESRLNQEVERLKEQMEQKRQAMESCLQKMNRRETDANLRIGELKESLASVTRDRVDALHKLGEAVRSASQSALQFTNDLASGERQTDLANQDASAFRHLLTSLLSALASRRNEGRKEKEAAAELAEWQEDPTGFNNSISTVQQRGQSLQEAVREASQAAGRAQEALEQSETQARARLDSGTVGALTKRDDLMESLRSNSARLERTLAETRSQHSGAYHQTLQQHQREMDHLRDQMDSRCADLSTQLALKEEALSKAEASTEIQRNLYQDCRNETRAARTPLNAVEQAREEVVRAAQAEAVEAKLRADDLEAHVGSLKRQVAGMRVRDQAYDGLLEQLKLAKELSATQAASLQAARIDLLKKSKEHEAHQSALVRRAQASDQGAAGASSAASSDEAAARVIAEALKERDVDVAKALKERDVALAKLQAAQELLDQHTISFKALEEMKADAKYKAETKYERVCERLRNVEDDYRELQGQALLQRQEATKSEQDLRVKLAATEADCEDLTASQKDLQAKLVTTKKEYDDMQKEYDDMRELYQASCEEADHFMSELQRRPQSPQPRDDAVVTDLQHAREQLRQSRAINEAQDKDLEQAYEQSRHAQACLVLETRAKDRWESKAREGLQRIDELMQDLKDQSQGSPSDAARADQAFADLRKANRRVEEGHDHLATLQAQYDTMIQKETLERQRYETMELERSAAVTELTTVKDHARRAVKDHDEATLRVESLETAGQLAAKKIASLESERDAMASALDAAKQAATESMDQCHASTLQMEEYRNLLAQREQMEEYRNLLAQPASAGPASVKPSEPVPSPALPTTLFVSPAGQPPPSAPSEQESRQREEKTRAEILEGLVNSGPNFILPYLQKAIQDFHRDRGVVLDSEALADTCTALQSLTEAAEELIEMCLRRDVLEANLEATFAIVKANAAARQATVAARSARMTHATPAVAAMLATSHAVPGTAGTSGSSPGPPPVMTSLAPAPAPAPTPAARASHPRTPAGSTAAAHGASGPQVMLASRALGAKPMTCYLLLLDTRSGAWHRESDEPIPDDWLALAKDPYAITLTVSGDQLVDGIVERFLHQPTLDSTNPLVQEGAPREDEPIFWYACSVGWMAGVTRNRWAPALNTTNFPGQPAVTVPVLGNASYQEVTAALLRLELMPPGTVVRTLPLWRRLAAGPDDGSPRTAGSLRAADAAALADEWPDAPHEPRTAPPRGLVEWRQPRQSPSQSGLDARLASVRGGTAPQVGGSGSGDSKGPGGTAAGGSASDKEPAKDSSDSAQSGGGQGKQKRAASTSPAPDSSKPTPTPVPLTQRNVARQDGQTSDDDQSDDQSEMVPRPAPVDPPDPDLLSEAGADHAAYSYLYLYKEGVYLRLPIYKEWTKGMADQRAKLHQLEKTVILQHLEEPRLIEHANRILTLPWADEQKTLNTRSLSRPSPGPVGNRTADRMAASVAMGSESFKKEITNFLSASLKPKAHNLTRPITDLQNMQAWEKRRAYYHDTGRADLARALQSRIDQCVPWTTILQELVAAAANHQHSNDCHWLTDHLQTLRRERILGIDNCTHFACEMLLAMLDQASQVQGTVVRPEETEMLGFLIGGRNLEEAARRYQQIEVAYNDQKDFAALANVDVQYCQALGRWLAHVAKDHPELHDQVCYQAEKRRDRANLPLAADGTPAITLARWRGFVDMLEPIEGATTREVSWHAELARINLKRQREFKQANQDQHFPDGKRSKGGSHQSTHPPRAVAPVVGGGGDGTSEDEKPPTRPPASSKPPASSGDGVWVPAGVAAGTRPGDPLTPAEAKQLIIDFDSTPHLHDYPLNGYGSRKESFNKSILMYNKKSELDKELIAKGDAASIEMRGNLSLVFPMRNIMKDGARWYCPPSSPDKDDIVYIGNPKSDFYRWQPDGTPTWKSCLFCYHGRKQRNGFDPTKEQYYLYGLPRSDHDTASCPMAKATAHFLRLSERLIGRHDHPGVGGGKGGRGRGDGGRDGGRGGGGRGRGKGMH